MQMSQEQVIHVNVRYSPKLFSGRLVWAELISESSMKECGAAEQGLERTEEGLPDKGNPDRHLGFHLTSFSLLFLNHLRVQMGFFTSSCVTVSFPCNTEYLQNSPGCYHSHKK